MLAAASLGPVRRGDTTAQGAQLRFPGAAGKQRRAKATIAYLRASPSLLRRNSGAKSAPLGH